MGAVGRLDGEDGHGAARRRAARHCRGVLPGLAAAPSSSSTTSVTPWRSCVASEWSATYFAGTALAGAPLAVQCLTELNETLLDRGFRRRRAFRRRTTRRGSRRRSMRVRARTCSRCSTMTACACSSMVSGLRRVGAVGRSGGEDRSRCRCGDGPHDIVVEYYQGWRRRQAHPRLRRSLPADLCGVGVVGDVFRGYGAGGCAAGGAVSDGVERDAVAGRFAGGGRSVVGLLGAVHEDDR